MCFHDLGEERPVDSVSRKVRRTFVDFSHSSAARPFRRSFSAPALVGAYGHGLILADHVRV